MIDEDKIQELFMCLKESGIICRLCNGEIYLAKDKQSKSKQGSRKRASSH